MPLLTFSIREQVPLILSGKKAQTTRLVGKRKLKVGDTLYLYFKPRMKQYTCKNCLTSCEYQFSNFDDGSKCGMWTNYFGEAIVTEIMPFRSIPFEEIDVWAIEDGFKTFQEAEKWFISKYGPEWYELSFQVITWKPLWVESLKHE